MTLREFVLGDREGCLAVFDSNVPDDFRVEERAEFEAFLDDLPGPYLVLEDEGGRIVACGGYAPEADGESVALCWGMVARDRQGEGLGRKLLEARLDRARADADYRRVVITTSHRTRGFFEKIGFEARQVTPDGIAPGLHRVDMTLELGTGDPDPSS